ncbi:putative integral membrane protein PTH11 [Rosellinia necatrix]|uniref:Putative integral membrane protein PTH11 n=1 Tax=Rosellinia necatrix TaxID=77044 RepID=A0A1W2TPD8_ROSNE|nr:putative integral membrane protein PTH11 [Rosellinia necatrix]
MDDISLLPPDKQAALLDGPALPPPPGRISRYENPPNENALSNFIVSLILALATIGLLIRVYSRLVCVKRVYFEDFLALGSYAIYVATNVYGVSLLCIKSAILLEWVRLFVPSGTRNAFYWLSTIGVAVNTTFYVAYIILQNLQCIPRDKIWDLTVKGKCISKYDIDIASSIINLVVDLAILVLPQQVIWKLQMSRRQRFGLSLMFAIGLVVIGVASYRLAAAITFYKSPDGLYNAPGLAFAALAEPTCVFLVFCLPTSPKVFKHIRARFRPADRSTDASPKPTRYGVETVGGTPYRKIKDDDTILLTEVTNTRNSDDGPPAGESGILRTIQFTAREEHIAGGAHN